MGELGELLRETRESKGISLAEVEEVTRIRQRFLQALEEEDFAALPGEVFARGFLRNYAMYLGLDPQQVAAMRTGQQGRADGRGSTFSRLPTDSMTFQWMDLSMRRPAPLFSLDLLAGTLIILGLLAFGGWWAYNQYLVPLLEATPTPVVAAAPTVPPDAVASPGPSATLAPTFTPTPTITPTPLFYTGVTVELVIHERSWLQVIVDDVKVFEGILETGERRNWGGEERVVVRCGNAGGVEIIVNGKSHGLLGEQGQVVDREWRKAPSPDALAPPTIAAGETLTDTVQATSTPLQPPPPPGTPSPAPPAEGTEAPAEPPPADTPPSQ
jgi:cytoskeletal protein RodZ